MNVELASRIEAPASYDQVLEREVIHNKQPIIWRRYVKQGATHDFGEGHFSYTIDKKSEQLKSYMYLDPSFETDTVPDEETTQTFAVKFLKEYAPDLLESMEIRWIKPLHKIPTTPPHDEGFTLNNNVVITGTRMKMWCKKEKNYAWVIVGKDNRVISFERDIEWDSVNHCRGTERWLHDKWLQENGYSLGQ